SLNLSGIAIPILGKIEESKEEEEECEEQININQLINNKDAIKLVNLLEF
ncbi:MAG: hypothetical protein GY788_24150, partial [bacterium]|nr:hypothetical protein [bacterium]